MSRSLPRIWAFYRERRPPSPTRRASAGAAQAVAPTGRPSALDLAQSALESVALRTGADPASTIRRYMATRKGHGGPASTTWRTFLASHASELWTMNLTTHPLWNYSARYVLVLMELRSRGVVHVAVTPSPTLAWVIQRIREATPFGSVPRFLVHNNDGIFGQFRRRRLGGAGRSYRSALDLGWGRSWTSRACPPPTALPMHKRTSSGSWEALDGSASITSSSSRKTIFAAPS